MRNKHVTRRQTQQTRPAPLPPTLDRLVPPPYCEYASGPCNQLFEGHLHTDDFFIYGNQPRLISDSIETAVEKLNDRDPLRRRHTWKALPIQGKVIFCEICKTIRHAQIVVADVTTLNFNALFEIGFAIGLGVKVIPIRDTTYQVHQRDFLELGLLDTFGYLVP